VSDKFKTSIWLPEEPSSAAEGERLVRVLEYVYIEEIFDSEQLLIDGAYGIEEKGELLEGVLVRLSAYPIEELSNLEKKAIDSDE